MAAPRCLLLTFCSTTTMVAPVRRIARSSLAGSAVAVSPSPAAGSSLVMVLADRVVVINAGRAIADGTGRARSASPAAACADCAPPR